MIKVNAGNLVDSANMAQPIDLDLFADVLEEYAESAMFDVKISTDDAKLSSGGMLSFNQKVQPAVVIKRKGYPDLIMMQELQGRQGFLNIYIPPSWADRMSNGFNAMVEEKIKQNGRGLINALIENRAVGVKARLMQKENQYIEAMVSQVIVPALQDSRSFDRGEFHIDSAPQLSIESGGIQKPSNPKPEKKIQMIETEPVPVPETKKISLPKPEKTVESEPKPAPPAPKPEPKPVSLPPMPKPQPVPQVTKTIPDSHCLAFVSREELEKGGRITVNTPSKEQITLDIHAGTPEHTVITALGRGKTDKESGKRGNLLVELVIYESSSASVKPVSGGDSGTKKIKTNTNTLTEDYVLDVRRLGFVTEEDLKNGCQVAIETKSKKKIFVDVPAGSRNGQIIRVAGRGRRNPDTGEKGDLLVELFVAEQ